MYRFLTILLTFVLLTSATALNVRTDVPERAKGYIELVMKEADAYFPEIPIRAAIPALVEQETCISLTHNYCWNPEAKLISKRERGYGFGMVTIAFDNRGRVRFDTITGLRLKYPEELSELTVANVSMRPDLQARALVLLLKDNYESLSEFEDTTDRLMAALSAYNGGLRDIRRAQAACKEKENCDYTKWVGNVGDICVKSRMAIYGDKSPCDINGAYAKLILDVRMPKYALYLDKIE